MATRFDQSFVIRMIRDFLLALTIIIVVELGGRLLIARYEFAHEGKDTTELAAERLASDIRDIMLNQGGPTAARTVYPILRRHHENLGLEIAVEPSPLTVEAITQRFGFEPKGLEPRWSASTDYHEATLPLEAEVFCTTCHVNARPGDVLGTVTVRNHRSVRMAEWWHEARVVSVVGMANVIVHTVVLFFLLRMRMEPLLQLRATVSRLAKGRLDLSRRTTAKSVDEFGELARDLNHFLDRLSYLVEDLDGVLHKVVAVNERLAHVSGTMGRQIGSVQDKIQTAMKHAAEIRGSSDAPSREALERLEASLRELAHELRDDSHYLAEILVLEERMKVVSESGRVLLGRIDVKEGDP